MSFLVIGILQAGTNNTLFVIFVVVGLAFPVWFLVHIRSSEHAGKEPLLSTSLFRNRTSNLGLVTQNVQWLLLIRITFVVSVFLQEERGFSAIKTGVISTHTSLPLACGPPKGLLFNASFYIASGTGAFAGATGSGRSSVRPAAHRRLSISARSRSRQRIESANSHQRREPTGYVPALGANPDAIQGLLDRRRRGSRRFSATMGS